MFKRILSVAIAATMMVGTFAFSASAAETAEAAAANESSQVGAGEDSSNVGADGSSDAGAEGSDTAGGSDTEVYFDANSTNWLSAAKYVRIYLYNIDDGTVLIPWDSKKGNMTEVEGKSGVYSFDLGSFGLNTGTNYGCIFLCSTGAQTCDVLVNTPCFGHTASCTSNMLENTVDSNKSSQEVVWDSGVDSSVYGVPLAITSTGKVIGSSIPQGKTKYSIFVDFLKEPGPQGLANATNYGEFKNDDKVVQKTVDKVAGDMGLSKSDVEKAMKEDGVEDAIKKIGKDTWSAKDSTLPGGSSDGGDTQDTTKAPGSGSGSGSGSGGSSSSSKTTGSSNSSSGSGSSSVSSGQETTIFFVLGGVMLAAAGLIFLTRKRREF